MKAQLKDVVRARVHYDPDRFVCQVGATVLQTGELAVIYNETRKREHIDFDSIAMILSRDGGLTWDAANRRTIWPCTYHFGSDTPSITQLKDGRLLVNFFQWAFVNQQGIYTDYGPQVRPAATRTPDSVGLVVSDDNGRTWSEGYRANIAPMRWAQPIDGVVELPDGTLLMACHGHLFSRAWMEVDNLHERCRSFILRSDNRGLDWEYYSTIAFDPATIISFDETSLVRCADGTLVAMIRTMHGVRNRHQHLWTAYSEDDGESWSTPKPTNIWGYPADLVALPDGSVLCTYGYRREPYGIRGCLSKDGRTWDVRNEFVISTGGQSTPDKVGELYYHIGYPSTVRLPDGSFCTIFHEWSQEKPYVQFVVSVKYRLAT